MTLSADAVTKLLVTSGIAQMLYDTLNPDIRPSRDKCQFGVAKPNKKCTLVCIRVPGWTWQGFSVEDKIGENMLSREQKTVIHRIVREGVLLTFPLATSDELRRLC